MDGNNRSKTRYLVVAVKDLFVLFPGYLIKNKQGFRLLSAGCDLPNLTVALISAF